ncbi:MAG: GNAT family N-acetyltransferase [Beijerinckiaceae bacterium]|nr:GNAT family N-acetyltransferase [Beijerinckiaceae bacterium]
MINAAQNPGPPEIVVRAATLKDASLLAELGARAFRESSLNTRHEDVECHVRENFTREKLKTCLSVKDTTALILETCGQAIGYAFLSPGVPSDQLVGLPRSIQIKWLYILREWTGRKLGNLLMARCLEHAAHSGFETIWLTVWKNNERAIHFYKRWGFRKVGMCYFIVGRDVQEDFVLLMNIPAA